MFKRLKNLLLPVAILAAIFGGASANAMTLPETRVGGYQLFDATPRQVETTQVPESQQATAFSWYDTASECSVAAKGGVQAYEVGTANALKARSAVGDALDIHHVGQARPLEQLVPGYSRATGPAIALPQTEHALIPTIRGTTTMSARDVLANDIRNLRNLTEAPNSSLQELIRLNKEMYPGPYAR